MNNKVMFAYFDGKSGPTILQASSKMQLDGMQLALFPPGAHDVGDDQKDFYITTFNQYTLLVCYFQLKSHNLYRGSCVYSVAVCGDYRSKSDIICQKQFLEQIASNYNSSIVKCNYDIRQVDCKQLYLNDSSGSETISPCFDSPVQLKIMNTYRNLVYFSLLCNYRVAILTRVPFWEIQEELVALQKAAQFEREGTVIMARFLGYVGHYNIKVLHQRRKHVQQLTQEDKVAYCGQLAMVADQTICRNFDVVVDLTGKYAGTKDGLVCIKNTNIFTTKQNEKIFRKFSISNAQFKLEQGYWFTKRLYTDVQSRNHGKEYGVGMNIFKSLWEFWYSGGNTTSSKGAITC